MDNSRTVPLKSRTLLNKPGTFVVGNYIVTEKRLGRGSSASVYLGHHTLRRFDVAVKKFELSSNNKRIERRAWREIQILQNIRHPNIIKMYDYHHDKKKNNIYVFLEYCPRGSIKTFLGKGGYLDEKYVNRLMRQFISGLKYLFSLGIYHRDIKPDNLLLSENYNLKISDFGLATLNNSGKFHRLCGSPLYMAPEILISASYNKCSDIWSIGMVMFELLFGHHPLRHIKHITDLIKYFNSDPLIRIPPDKKPDDANLSSECINLIQKMLITDYDKRLTWEKLFDHPWINKNMETQKVKHKNNDDSDNDSDDNNGRKKDKKNNKESKYNSVLNNLQSNSQTQTQTNNYHDIIDTNTNIDNFTNKNSIKNNIIYTDTLSDDVNDWKLNHKSWSPLYLPVLEWKYNKNVTKIKNDINYEIHDTHLGENTYMSHSIKFEKNLKKCVFINNEVASIEIKVKKNNNILKKKIELAFSDSDSITNSPYITKFTLKKKLATTVPSIPSPPKQKRSISLECHQTWPLPNFSDETSFAFYFDHVPAL